MAKPIFVVTIRGNIFDITDEYKHNVRKGLEGLLGKDYHILISFKNEEGGPSFECFNDCKGLKDIDIEKLINEFYETKST